MNNDVLKLRMQDNSMHDRWLKSIVQNGNIVGISWTDDYEEADDFTDIQTFIHVVPTRILKYLRYLSKHNREFFFDKEEHIDTRFFNSMIEYKGE